MKDELKETLSCFVDAETDIQSVNHWLARPEQSEQIRNKISRYQLIGEVLKNEPPVMLKSDFSSTISARIRQEPVHFHPRRKTVIHWKISTVAVAASLALIAVLTPQMLRQPDNVTAAGGLHPVIAKQQPLTVDIQQQPTRLVRVQPQPINPRFNAYLQAHSNRIYTVGASSYQPYARVAGFRQD